MDSALVGRRRLPVSGPLQGPLLPAPGEGVEGWTVRPVTSTEISNILKKFSASPPRRPCLDLDITFARGDRPLLVLQGMGVERAQTFVRKAFKCYRGRCGRLDDADFILMLPGHSIAQQCGWEVSITGYPHYKTSAWDFA